MCTLGYHPLHRPLIDAGAHRAAGACMVEAYQQRFTFRGTAQGWHPIGTVQALHVAAQHADGIGG
jgi:hypothetical protein